jgi:aldose sugar dehydrogenase
MKGFLKLVIILLVNAQCATTFLVGQTFTRSELPTPLTIPWEITYGPDNYLWITESGGTVSRVHPGDGSKTVVYTAPDYFGGSPLEDHDQCFNPSIGAGTLGLALHPDFMHDGTAFIYFVYSYNQGTTLAPQTRFKVKRLLWNHSAQTVTGETDLILNMPTGYDHLGGRLLIAEQNDTPYLFMTTGDNGISESNSPDCYADQAQNPNVQAQNPDAKNGKIHRFHLDGTIPVDNPIPGNSFYTRGHRNPQGLMYNPHLDVLYSIEHGDRTDDEINILHKGMNYGWKYVRGYHNDNNVTGESYFIDTYAPHPQIANDSLVEAFYSWCDTLFSTSGTYTNWCTVAPSDGIYYGSTAIPDWYNSLLVVTLKNGVSTDMEVYQFKLLYNGELAPSTPENPNPKKYFGEDQLFNGRLRDICISPDGKTIFLINNFGTTPAHKITVYRLDPASVQPFDYEESQCAAIFPNPSPDQIQLIGTKDFQNMEIRIIASDGTEMRVEQLTESYIDISGLASGSYVLNIQHDAGVCNLKFIKSE